MITKTAGQLRELDYKKSWGGKLNAAKEVTPGYIAANSVAKAMDGTIFGTGGALLLAALPTKANRGLRMAQRLALAGRLAAKTAPATAASAVAYGALEAPIEYAYTKGFVPSKNPIKSTFGYVQADKDVLKKYVNKLLL